MWEGYFQGDLLSARSLLTCGKLLTFEVDRGIDDEWWGPTPGTGADDPTDDRVNAGGDTALQRTPVDQDDLLSLLSGMTAAADPPSQSKNPRSPRRATKRAPSPRGRDSRSSD
ncbi:hypothetical protein [Micromonospora ureilytica]|uniref:hypothetical protein n=1 Tax=Micromonospora ureilytica TaxID=709868 RepID=UPI00403A2B72